MLCLLLITAVCCTSRVPAAAPLEPAALTVVTWNMHAGRGDLGRLMTDLGSGRLADRPVRDYVLLLQEAQVEAALAAPAPVRDRELAWFFVPVRLNGDGASGNAIASTLGLEDARAIDLPRERQPRAAASAAVRVDGERLFVVSAHLENRLALLRGVFGDRARHRQARALIEQLPPAVHGIAGGDMNTMLGPGEPALRALLERFDDTPRDRSEPTFRDRLVLDHLFFDLPDGWRATRRVAADLYGSDHRPVVGQVFSASSRAAAR